MCKLIKIYIIKYVEILVYQLHLNKTLKTKWNYIPGEEILFFL